jgi:hypothetical protein
VSGVPPEADQKTKNRRTPNPPEAEMSKEKTSSFEIPCSIFDIQNRDN